MTDFAEQRKNMVDAQVRPSDVTDRRIPRAMLTVPREAFVPGSLRSIAYMDENLRVAEGGGGRFLLAPRVLAKLIQSLEIGDSDVVLDIAGATGYSAAILARLAGRVVALESDALLAERAEILLRDMALPARSGPPVKLVLGPLAAGVAGDGPYDAILINGAIADVPRGLLDQLKDGGRLAAVRIERGIGRATLWRRHAMQFDQRLLFDAAAPPLAEFGRRTEFVF